MRASFAFGASDGITITVEVRLFNSLARPGEGPRRVELPAGGTIGDLMRRIDLPAHEVTLVLRNGRDVTPGLYGGPVRTDVALDHGDVIAFSGPVPFSWGMGAPVV